MLAVGLEATVADDEAFEEVGDGPVDERLWPGARHGDGQLEGCEGQVFREGERAATGVGGGALESDGPRSEIVGGDELDVGGLGVERVAGTKFGGDDIVIVRFDADEALVGAEAGVFFKQGELGGGGGGPRFVSEGAAGFVAERAEHIHDGEEGEVETVPDLWIQGEPLDEGDERERAGQRLRRVAGEDGEADGGVGGVGPEIGETRHVKGGGVVEEGAERRSEYVGGLLGVAVERAEARAKVSLDGLDRRWLRRGLPYAPIVALTAAIAPDIVMPGGHWVLPWSSAQAWGALVTAGWCFWRRNDRQALTVSIVVGLVVYLVLRVGFGL